MRSDSLVYFVQAAAMHVHASVCDMGLVGVQVIAWLRMHPQTHIFIHTRVSACVAVTFEEEEEEEEEEDRRKKVYSM